MMKNRSLKPLSALLLLIVFFSTLLTSTLLKKIGFDYSFESFFPENDEELTYYEQFISAFGQQNDFLFIAFEKVDLLDTVALLNLSQIEKELESQKEVLEVVGPFDEKIIQATPFGLNKVSKYNAEKGIQIDDPFTQIDIGRYFSKDGDAILMVLRHESFNKKGDADLFYQKLLKILHESYNEEVVVSGKIQMQKDFTDLLEQELGLLLSAGFAICLIILLFLFKSIQRVLITVGVMALTICWTLIAMVALGKSIDVMLVMLPAILLIISLSDCIHLINKYDFLCKTFDKEQAIIKATRATGKANFITSLTTAIGFLGLLFLPIGPIKDFGLYAALGIMIAFVTTMIVVPSLLVLLPQKNLPNRTNGYHLYFKANILEQTLTLRGQRLTLILTVLLIAGSAFIQLNTGLIVGLQKKEPMLQKVAYFDEHFSGYRPIEVGIQLNNAEATDSLISHKVERIELALQEHFGTENISSSNSIIKKINSALYGGSMNYLRLPKEKDIPRVRRIYQNRNLTDLRSTVSIDSIGLLRIVGLSPDLGSAYFLDKTKKVQEVIETLNNDQFTAKLTGSSYLIDKTDNYVIQALMKGLGFACITVALITFLFYRSWRISLLVLVVNAIPLALLFGIMGYLGIDLNISTAIIFTVAFGIAVDDSIHLIARFQQERKVEKNKTKALFTARTQTGESIIFTSIAIASGFGVLLFSGFSAVYYLGLFICLSAIIALWYDLLVLPYLIEKWKNL